MSRVLLPPAPPRAPDLRVVDPAAYRARLAACGLTDYERQVLSYVRTHGPVNGLQANLRDKARVRRALLALVERDLVERVDYIARTRRRDSRGARVAGFRLTPEGGRALLLLEGRPT
jgi:hypothetical protein